MSHLIVYFARRRCDDEVSVDILFAKLLGDVQAQRAVVVVDISFRLIAENTVSPIDFFELCDAGGDAWEKRRLVSHMS